MIELSEALFNMSLILSGASLRLYLGTLYPRGYGYGHANTRNKFQLASTSYSMFQIEFMHGIEAHVSGLADVKSAETVSTAPSVRTIERSVVHGF